MENLLSNSVEFESIVIKGLPELTANQKCCACQWLSGRQSIKAKEALQQLLSESHPGVRLAAAVGLARVDPLFDLSPMREEMLASAISSPAEFMLAFYSMSDAVSALALAGHTDKEAEDWLNQDRTPKLKSLCDDAATTMSIGSSDLGWKRSIPWQHTTISLEETPEE